MNKQELTVTLTANTDNLSAKLRAIAKHAESLANELDEIDEDSCPECGALMDVTKFHSCNEVFNVQASCSSCGYTKNDE